LIFILGVAPPALILFPGAGKTEVVPVGQLPSVTVSVTPTIHALPILLLDEMGEWKDFGIQVKVKVHANGEEQIGGIAGNEWEVAVMDPFYAVKGGNDGDVSIVGLAGLLSPKALPLIQKGSPLLTGGPVGHLPVFLVATSAYADTRKTLVIRWLEGYARGLDVIQKTPSKAASLLKTFYQDKLKIEVPEQTLEKELKEAFVFEEQKRDEAFMGKEGKASQVEVLARIMTDYLFKVKAIESRRDPAEYVLSAVCGQLSKLRGEAEAQLRKTRSAIDRAQKEGMPVGAIQKKWEEARGQLQEGRGCLTVIGILSDLERSAEQGRVATRRLHEFRKIEAGVGGVLALYFFGYFIRRRKKRQSS